MNAASSSNSLAECPVAGPRRALASPPCPATRPLPRHAPAIGGFTPFSTADWPGTLSAVVFIAGCPWRCHYCHNPALQTRGADYDWRDVQRFLATRRGLLDGVVFSGGEPLSEPRLYEMVDTARALGFRIGLHTAGIYPARLAALLPALDWVGLDIKADAAGYDAITGRRNSAGPAVQSLAHLLASGCDAECRITWHPDWLDEARLLALATELSGRGVRRFAVQNARTDATRAAPARLSTPMQHALRALFPTFECR